MTRFVLGFIVAAFLFAGAARAGYIPMPLAVANGGTGATSASAARSALSAASSGANSDITSLASLGTALSVGQGGTGATSASAARTALGVAPMQCTLSGTPGACTVTWPFTPTNCFVSVVGAVAIAPPVYAISSTTITLTGLTAQVNVVSVLCF